MTKKPLEEQTTGTEFAFRGLESLREFWQTTAPYDPMLPLDSVQTRYELGKFLREQTPERLMQDGHRQRIERTPCQLCWRAISGVKKA